MTSRKRVIAAMERREVDRVPVIPCLWLNHIARVAGIPYGRILAFPAKMYDAIYRTREFYDADGMRALILPPPDWRAGTLAREVDGRMTLLSEKTGQPVAFFDTAGGGAIRLIDKDARILDRRGWQVGRRVESLRDVKRIPVFSARELHQAGRTEPLRELVKKVAGRHFVIAFAGGGQTTNPLLDLRGSAQGLMDLVEDPKLVDAITDRCTEASVEEAKALVDVGADAIFFGDSSASSSMISPEHYRRFCAPRYRQFVASVRAYAPHVKIYQHCCGNYNPILETAADEGVDALHGLDPTEGMDLADVKRRVGDRVCLFGGVRTLTFLTGAPEDLRAESKECMAAGGEEGYILDAACAIPPQSPFENIRAMCMAPRDC